MSLAATGGAGMGGGAGLSMSAMAHNAGAPAVHQPPPQTHSSIPNAGPGMAAPGTSYAALGADLLDKNQSFLSAKGVRNVSHLPIVAVDLYGDGCGVSYFPPLEKDEDEDDGDEASQMMKAMARIKRGVQNRSVGKYSTQGADVVLRKDDTNSYKAVRRYLTKGEGHVAVLGDALVLRGSKKKNGDSKGNADEDDVLSITRPHLVMGARRPSELNAAARSALRPILPEDGPSSPAISEANPLSVSLTTIALDGNSSPKGDDYDRVVYQIKLSSKKKAMTILPEEAVSLVVARCRQMVGDNFPDLVKEEGEDVYLSFPPAFAIPGWAALDSTVEALTDAARGGGSPSGCGPSLHQRSVAAAVGALLPTAPNSDGGGFAGRTGAQPGARLHTLLSETMQARDAEAMREFAREASRDPTLEKPLPFVPLVLLAGATKEGLELTAAQISEPQGTEEELHCPFGNILVVASVCLPSPDPLSLLSEAMDELRSRVGRDLPESEEPTAILTYGSTTMQKKVADGIKEILTRYGEEGKDDNEDWDGWDQDVPLVSSTEDCVSLGLAVLAASVHGRVRVVISRQGTDGRHRAKAKLGLRVQDAATSAVAVSFNYFGGERGRWTPPKVIFDFDRRVPAGPYRIDFSAAECAAHFAHAKTGATGIEDEAALTKATKALAGKGGIPQREAAALGLCFRVYQRVASRAGGAAEDADEGWIRMGDRVRPLSMRHSQKDEGESGEDNMVAIESATMEISLSAVGLISTSLVTNGETIVQATKSARNSKLLRYGSMLAAVLFFGGFLLKSYMEERIFERDTQRVLAYYKHAAANSFHDGDERQARYLVWKYKKKKDALWRRLEAKYGVPVRHAWEWEEDGEEEEKRTEEEDGETEDLDGEGKGEEL